MIYKVTYFGRDQVIRDGRGFGYPMRKVGYEPAYFVHKPLASPLLEIEEISDPKLESKAKKEIADYQAALKKAKTFQSKQKASFADGSPIDPISELVAHEMGTKKMQKRIVVFNQNDTDVRDKEAFRYSKTLDKLEQTSSITEDPPKLPGER